MSRGSLVRSLSALTFAAWAGGCISPTAGYRDAQASLAARTGVRVPVLAIDDAETASAVKDMLAAPLTADSAARIALLHSAEVQVAFDGVGVARGALVTAVRLPNPRIEGTLRFREGRDPDIGIGASINVMELVFLPLRARASSANLDAAANEAVGTAMDVSFEARMAFFDYVAADRAFVLAKQVVVVADASAKLSRELTRAGNQSELAALEEETRYQEARVMLGDADTARRVARERLNAALGLWGEAGTTWTAIAVLPDPPAEAPSLDGVEKAALEKSLDLAIARDRYASAAHTANLAIAAGVIPELDVGVDAERDPEGWGVGPKVGIALPIFSQNEGAIDASKAEMRRQEALIDALAVQIRSEARALATRVETAKEEISFYGTTLLPLRAKVVSETEKHVNAMDLPAVRLFDAKREELDATRAYAGVLREYWSARAALDLLLAGRLSRPLAHDFGLGVRTGGAGME